MSYHAAAALQEALFATLSADAALEALLPGGIFDAPPPGTPQGTYCVIGAESVIDRSDASGAGAEHRVEFSVVSDASGFATAKAAAARISQMLPDTQPALGSGRVAAIWFHGARARRLEGGAVRRIDLTFRIRVET